MDTQAQNTTEISSPMGMNWWTPVTAWQTAHSVNLQKTVVTLASEWQAFVGRRMKEDVSLLQQLGAVRSPDQLWKLYATFWQNAAADYAQEYVRLAKLAGTCAMSGAAVANESLRSRVEAPPLPKAA